MDKKKICFLAQGSTKWIAGSIYILNIIKGIQKRYPEIEIILLLSSKSDKSYFDACKNSNFKILHYSWRNSSSIFENILDFGYSIIKNRKIESVESLIKKLHPDFVYPSDKESKKYRSAHWIQDLQHKLLPKFFPNKHWDIREAGIKNRIKNNNQIVLSSFTALSHLENFYNVQNKRLNVLRFTSYIEESSFTNDPLIIAKKFNLPEKFYIFSSNFWKHKNHKNLFESIKQVKKIIPDICLVLTGALNDYRSPEYKDELLNFISGNELSSNIKILGLINRNEQIQLLRQSVFIIQPSYFEGWSSLVEDARAIGKPIILSDIPIHREQAPFEGVFFNPDDINELSRILIDIWQTHIYGPDLEKESLARIENEKRLEKLAEDFINLTE